MSLSFPDLISNRTNTIYWNVRNNADQSLISRVANTLYTNDMMRLVDKRGDETITYPVVRVTFSDGTSVGSL